MSLVVKEVAIMELQGVMGASPKRNNMYPYFKYLY